MVLNILTIAPVCADAKHSLPILDLCDRPTRKTFDFALISTASKTPETPQAEPSKFAKVEVLPQLQGIPDVQCDCVNGFSPLDECAMYLVIEGQPCAVTIGCLKSTEVRMGQECEDVEDKLVI